eukprot:CCRYP_014225-RA/>CCRYP_014225-RA protein AED:0.36 eAED:0.45 QI:0/0/0.5/1/0/0/2/1100/69
MSTDFESSPATEVTKEGSPLLSMISRIGLPFKSVNVTSFRPEITTSESVDFTQNLRVDPIPYDTDTAFL